MLFVFTITSPLCFCTSFDCTVCSSSFFQHISSISFAAFFFYFMLMNGKCFTTISICVCSQFALKLAFYATDTLRFRVSQWRGDHICIHILTIIIRFRMRLCTHFLLTLHCCVSSMCVIHFFLSLQLVSISTFFLCVCVYDFFLCYFGFCYFPSTKSAYK